MANAFDQFDDQPRGPNPFDVNDEPRQNFFDMPESDRQVSRLIPNVNRIMKGLSAFGEGFKEGLQPESLGLSDESKAWLAGKNVLPKDASDYTNPMKPFMAFNEGIILPLAVGIDTIAKSPMALYRGMQSLGAARGLPGDLVSVPDAFMGSPHPMGIPQVPLAEPKPFVKPVDIKPIEGSPNPGLLHSVAAKTGDPLIDAILDNPVLKQVIDNPVVDDSHTIPNSLGGSTPVDNPTLYRDKDFPKTMTVDGVTFDTAEPSAVHENVEEFVIDALVKGGMDQATALKVAFWNFGEVAEDAWYRAHGIDPEKVEAKYTEYLNRIASRGIDTKVFESSTLPAHNADISSFKTSFPDAKPLGVPDTFEIPMKDNAGALEVAHSFGAVKVRSVYVEADFEGKGYGVKAYKELVDWALARNLKVQSSSSVKAGAVRLYDALERRGYSVERNPNSLISPDGNVRTSDAKPAFVITKDKGVPPDLFKGTYPDRDPAKAGPGPIDKPTPQESARGRQMLEGYLSGEGNPSGIVAFHGSPHSFEKFDFSKIGTGEAGLDQNMPIAQRQVGAYGAGGYFAENKAVARSYQLLDAINDDTGRNVTIQGRRFDVNNPMHKAVSMVDEFGSRDAAIQEAKSRASKYSDDFYDKVAARLESDKPLPEMDVKGRMYQVSIKADPEHFLDWDKPLSEQSEHVKQVLKQMGVDPERRGYLAQTMVDDLATKKGAGYVSGAGEEALREAGIPGIKYLDQGSRVEGRGTRNYVLFDDNLVQITHVNGQPILDAARDLGVVGPPKVPLTEGKPAEVAARAVGGDGGGGGVSKPPGGGDGGPPQGGGGEPPQPGANPWRNRFEHFVGKLETPDDVKQLIREAADEKGEFPVARQGEISLSHVEAIAEAAGVEPGEIDARGLGRKLKNDAEVRTSMQLMLQVTENVKTAARDVRSDGSPESLIKFQEAIMRRDLAVEQVVGLRAEWGRTGNVFQEFQRNVKDQEGLSSFLKDKGRTPKDLRDIADAVDALDRSQTARVLNDMRTPTGWDKFMWYWVNALISGPVTHAKYVIANAAFAGYESAVVTPVAGVVGAVRRSLLGGNEGVFAGEAAARVWGLIAGTPDAIVAAVKAARTGLQTPLPGEIAQNILPKQNKGLAFQQKPIEGPVGTLIGIPSRGAAGIHSLFNFLGYRASMEAQAYRAAAKEGLSPTDQAFWERRQSAADAPTKEMMDNAIEEGYRLTYISELSPAGKLMSRAIKSTKIGQLLLPFTHIPFNILSRGLEGTPAAFLTAEARADVFGKNGVVKQDMAVARLVAGSAVGAWTVNLVLNDHMTGYGPTDPKERAQWLATGHQPYSVRIGNEWYSFNRFGSLGVMLGLYANLAEAIPHLKPDAEELTKALVMTVHSTGRLLEDEVGMQGLAGLIDAINDPDRKGTRFVSNFAGSLLPYSSALRQTASAMDPEMRETKSVVDGLRYYIPVVRQDLLPKRDWLGEPITNAGYGGDLPIPGLSAIIQHRPVGGPEIAEEMKRLDLHPAVPTDRVGGVKLPPKLYDQYQMAAGQLTRQVLNNWLAQPNWHQMPEFARAEVFRRSISAARQQAGAMMMGMYPQIIQQGVQQRVDQISGVKPTKLKD